MDALYRFNEVRCPGSEQVRSFTLHAGDVRQIVLDARDEKNVMIDYAIGAEVCAEGSIEIAQGERRHDKHPVRALGERRTHIEPIPLIWQPLSASRPGRVAWVAANGGLISNLRIWENVSLPLWYHNGHEMLETEQNVIHWLPALGIDQGFERFMAAQPHSIELWQRKLAGLLRALLQKPVVMVVDSALLGNIKENIAQGWISAMESYAAEGGAVLVIADKAVPLLQWERIE